MSITSQRAFETLADSFRLRSHFAPPEVAPAIRGVGLAFGAAGRLSERSADVVLRLARRHAGNAKFQELCENL